MERALKERIVGAAVLVVFVVLVVPIFLDGPPGEQEVRTERVVLPGQEGQDTQTVVLERDRTDPVPVGAATGARQEPPRSDAPVAERASEPAPVVEEQTRPAEPEVIPVPEPESTSMPSTNKAPSAATSTTGMWAVQLGSFSNKANAEKLVADLRKQQYLAFLSQVKTDQGTLHRVRIGPQKDRAGAEAIAARLARAGYSGQVVPHP